MKKIVFSVLMVVLTLGITTAQDEIFTARIKKEEVPQAITAAIERDFPGMIASNFKTLPVEFVEGSFVLLSNETRGKGSDTYLVVLTGPNFKAEATYDGSGKLISAREHMKNVVLPAPVERAIGKDYPGWVAAKDYEMLTINREDQQKAYYRVELTKGADKMWATYDAHGNETKAGKEHRMHREQRKETREKS